MKKLTVAYGILSIAIFTGCVKDFKQETATQNEAAHSGRVNPSANKAIDEFVPNELLIKFKPGASETGRTNALAHISGKIKERVVSDEEKHTGKDGFYVVSVPNGVLEAVERLKNLADIEYAEPNYIYRLPTKIFDDGADAHDTYYTTGNPNRKDDYLWGMMGDYTTPHQNTWASRAGEIWSGAVGKDATTGSIIYSDSKKYTGSSDVYVAVIDQGVDDDNPDFQWKETDENGNVIRSGNNIATAYGRDFASGDWDPDPTHPAEDHGTHVAGTIGAVGNNEQGVAGVCWRVSIISVRFLNERGMGTAANAAKAINYVNDLKGKGVNIIATNNSWGGLSSKAISDAITRANSLGILFIAAAGNDNKNIDANLVYPACYPHTNIISVASISLDGTKSSFSNWGQKNVDIAAPGQWIWSTVPVGCSIDDDVDKLNNGIGHMSGTSMATPHVTGAVAMYKSVKPSATATQIKNAIMNSARPTASFERICVSKGRLDIPNAVYNY
jgi:subtilisin family serine protease